MSLHTPALIDWLLESDPAIRWQVMRDLLGESDEAVARERSLVAERGWGAQLLGRQRSNGTWGDGVTVPPWQSTLCTLVLLKNMGIDPGADDVRRAIRVVGQRVTWGPEFGNAPFFEGEVEPCINGRVLGLGAWCGHPSERLRDRILSEQLADGGWNCEAERGSVRSSFHTTVCVLEGLLAYEQAVGVTHVVTQARLRGQEYLLARRMFRRLSTGEVIADRKATHDWMRHFGFPPTWRYDVLRGLDYLRAAGAEPDDRAAEAVHLVSSRRQDDGRWQHHEHEPDSVQFPMEVAAQPGRWNTLRALRVLQWHA